MKKLITLLLVLIVMTSGNSSKAANIITVQDGRTTGSFKGIAAGGPITIKVTLGNTEGIRFEGDKDAIDELITEVKEGILIIRPKTKWGDWSRKYNRANVVAYVAAKKLSSATMSGSGNLEVTNTINGADFTATLSGSGGIKAAANVKSLTAVLSGSGNIDLSGKSTDANLTISGSGNFRGKNFNVSNVSVQVSGSANVNVRASQSLEAVISGSGNIYYTGDATVKKTIIGSGSVSKG